MRKQVERHTHGTGKITRPRRRLDERPRVAYNAQPSHRPEFLQSDQRRVQSEGSRQTRGSNLEEVVLRYRNSGRLARSRVRRVIIVGNDHVSGIIAAEEKDTDESFVIGLRGRI